MKSLLSRSNQIEELKKQLKIHVIDVVTLATDTANMNDQFLNEEMIDDKLLKYWHQKLRKMKMKQSFYLNLLKKMKET